MAAFFPTLWFVIYCRACKQERLIIILRGKEIKLFFVILYHALRQNATYVD